MVWRVWLVVAGGAVLCCAPGREPDYPYLPDETDAGAPDAAPSDGGDTDGSSASDAGADGGMPDAASPDSGAPDAGAPDAGPPDAGIPDAGVDAGFGNPCQTDADCSALAVCLEQAGSGTCVAPCTSDGQCPFGSRCAAALDSGRDHCLAECSSSAQCNVDAQCVSGLCQTHAANGAQYCQTDSGCPQNESCQGTTCAHVTMACDACGSGMTCGSGFVCTPLLLTGHSYCMPLCDTGGGDCADPGFSCALEALTGQWECEPDNATCP
jgi:hypothetical protein